jgi:septation ring formation regulator EzrA
MDVNLESILDRIRDHIKVLNHSSERMANALDGVEDDLNELSQRVSAIEANLGWLMKLIWIILGGIVMIVFRMFAPPV